MMYRQWILVTLFVGVPTTAWSADVNVSNGSELRAAMQSAVPGDRIVAAPGTYDLTHLGLDNSGTELEPITLTGAGPDSVRIDVSTVVGIELRAAYWIFENVHFNGICSPITNCAHAIQVKWLAHHTHIRACRFTNFYQHIKGSGRSPDHTIEVSDVTIESSEFFNNVKNGGTPIDIVGGDRWWIVGNYVHDFGGAPPDYGMFLKGQTRDSIMERNLVVCQKDYNWPGATVGMSFGGGGTGSQFCPNNDCSCEDIDGIARNNIIVNCSDAGLHTKRACGSKFYNNTVYDTLLGLQVQIDGGGAQVDIRNNVFSHHIVGGTNRVEFNNLEDVTNSEFLELYADPDNLDFSAGTNPAPLVDAGEVRADVFDDYCGSTRTGTPDIGAIEFPAACATDLWTIGGVIPGPGPDGGMPDGGMMDGGMPDGGTMDGGMPDGGMMDGGPPDGGTMDGGMPDGGMMPGDSGDGDGDSMVAQSDGGDSALEPSSDGEIIRATDNTIVGGCQTGPVASLWSLLLFGVVRRKTPMTIQR